MGIEGGACTRRHDRAVPRSLGDATTGTCETIDSFPVSRRAAAGISARYAQELCMQRCCTPFGVNPHMETIEFEMPESNIVEAKASTVQIYC